MLNVTARKLMYSKQSPLSHISLWWWSYWAETCKASFIQQIDYVTNTCYKAVPYLRRLVSGFPPRRPGFEPRSGHVGFVVDKVELGQVFSEYFGLPCQFSFHRLLHIHHLLSSGSGTKGKFVADVPSGLSLTPPQENTCYIWWLLLLHHQQKV
jgi:hypothetical protein